MENAEIAGESLGMRRSPVQVQSCFKVCFADLLEPVYDLINHFPHITCKKPLASLNTITRGVGRNTKAIVLEKYNEKAKFQTSSVVNLGFY